MSLAKIEHRLVGRMGGDGANRKLNRKILGSTPINSAAWKKVDSGLKTLISAILANDKLVLQK